MVPAFFSWSCHVNRHQQLSALSGLKLVKALTWSLHVQYMALLGKIPLDTCPGLSKAGFEIMRALTG